MWIFFVNHVKYSFKLDYVADYIRKARHILEIMRALIGLCITLAIVTTIHIQSTLCVCFFKRHLIGLQCPVTIETKSHLIHIEAFS